MTKGMTSFSSSKIRTEGDELTSPPNTKEHTMDPWQAPDADHTELPPAGSLDIGLAFSEGFDAMKRNFLNFFLMMIAAFFTILVLECSMIGLIAIPVVMWGLFRFLLDTLDGEPEVKTLYSGFQNFGPNLIGIGGVYFLMIGAIMPFIILLYGGMFGGMALQFALAPEAMQNSGGGLPIYLFLGYGIGIGATPLEGDSP